MQGVFTDESGTILAFYLYVYTLYMLWFLLYVLHCMCYVCDPRLQPGGVFTDGSCTVRNLAPEPRVAHWVHCLLRVNVQMDTLHDVAEPSPQTEGKGLVLCTPVHRKMHTVRLKKGREAKV